ncbi:MULTISPECIES: ABC transporter permease DevC [unclassified Nostoc]|uniref:ABC transporter permease DevC n=1 Tax=unclassified Nostoc TaxID=2593658 RepID=UPI002AD2DB20|nr:MULTISPECIES: ABC transporter permease DevC [unclassified Nostoc]MDZ8120620.1 ABC transporter permease DevC [Nostoc sp. CmiVER01]MDZ8225134.1 ABC transporter permease DevC [Nostoc sp. ChiVER01]
MKGLIQQLQQRTPLGWLQLNHEKSRLFVALSGIAFADILMFMQLGFMNALFDTSVLLHRKLKADAVLISPQARDLANIGTIPRRRLYQAMDVPGVKSAQPLYINFIDWKNPQTQRKTSMLVVGINPERVTVDLPEVNQNLKSIKLSDTVLFDRTSRGDYKEIIAKIEQGKTVKTEIERRTVTISGLFQVGASFSTDGTLITSDQSFLRLFPQRQAGAVSLGLIQFKPDNDPVQVTAALKAYLPKDVQVLTLEEFIDSAKDYEAKNRPIGFIFGLGTVVGFIVGIVIVYQVLSTDVNAHIKEYATFKAMGYRTFYLLGVVFEEALILAVLGFIPGASIAIGLYHLVRNATNLPLSMPLLRGVFVLLLTLVMCTISGAIATRKLQSADPADMF